MHHTCRVQVQDTVRYGFPPWDPREPQDQDQAGRPAAVAEVAEKAYVLPTGPLDARRSGFDESGGSGAHSRCAENLACVCESLDQAPEPDHGLRTY
jgi:hypothetical protein